MFHMIVKSNLYFDGVISRDNWSVLDKTFSIIRRFDYTVKRKTLYNCEGLSVCRSASWIYYFIFKLLLKKIYNGKTGNNVKNLEILFPSS